MLRSLSTKLLLAVLAAVIVPFGGFALFLEHQIAGRMTRDFVRQTLLGLAGDLAAEVDAELHAKSEDVALWSQEPFAAWALLEAEEVRQNGRKPWGAAEVLLAEADSSALSDPAYFRLGLTLSLNRYVRTKTHYDRLLLIGTDGRLVLTSGVDPRGGALESAQLEHLFAHDFASEPWFAEALAGSFALVNHHVSPLLSAVSGESAEHHIGIAAPVRSFLDDERIVGVFYALLNWRLFQDLINRPVIKDAFRGLVASGDIPSPYAWIWDSDADTILAHQDPSLYYERVSGPRIRLPQMVADARAQRSGMYRDYTFQDVRKTAAFQRTAPRSEGGFDWVVGVGINDTDIVAASRAQRLLLSRGTLAVLLCALLWILVIARRTVAPIAALEEHTRRVAGGDLSARVHLARSDELGRLALAMNRMTGDLEAQRDKLIKAEKDAAWREMARQVAHDLKNPLTPIQLSLELYERAAKENHPDREQILARTLELVRRQVASLRDVARDFYEFTGGAKARPQHIAVRAVLDKVLDLYGAWALESHVTFEVDGSAGEVFADPAKLERVLNNLVSNALQAMPEGGTLSAVLRETEARVVLELKDTGIGLAPDVRAHLFEPYFTTKGEGTGLGLATAARLLEDMGGTLALTSAGEGQGTKARVEWVRARGNSA